MLKIGCPLFQAGKIWHYVLIILILVILCFRQGRLAFRANNFGLSSVLVGREVKCEVLVIWKVNNS